MSRLKDLLAAERAKAERKHCGPDDEDRARLEALAAEVEAPERKAARDGAARSAGKLASATLPRLQRLVSEALLQLGGDPTAAEVLAHLKRTRRVSTTTRKYDITRAIGALRRRIPPQI